MYDRQSAVYNNLRRSTSMKLNDFIKTNFSQSQLNLNFHQELPIEGLKCLNSTVKSPARTRSFSEHEVPPKGHQIKETGLSLCESSMISDDSQMRTFTMKQIKSFISNLTKKRESLNDDLSRLISRKLNISSTTHVPYKRIIPSLWPPLTPEMEKTIHNCFCMGHHIVSCFGIDISVEDMMTLQPNNWLNNDIINYYLQLINSRSSQFQANIAVSQQILAKTFCLNTFFYPKLCSAGYSGVRRWTKRQNLNIFSLDLLLIPIHLSIHWCLVAVDFARKTVTYYDSLGGDEHHSFKILNQIIDFVEAEFEDKNPPKYFFCKSEWKLTLPNVNPQQRNGNDCGVFLCCSAELLARYKPLFYCQEDIPFVRKKIIYEIVNKKLIC